MEVVRDDLWLCVDCTVYACNADLTGIDTDERAREVSEGVASLGGFLVPAFDSESGEGCEEFSACGCDACGSQLAGEMHRFAVLG
jgi:hypothetical protein